MRVISKHSIGRSFLRQGWVFTDAYDLFIIGIVNTMLIPIWHLIISQLALLNSVALAAAAIGAISFGLLSDKFRRKRLYAVEVLILF